MLVSFIFFSNDRYTHRDLYRNNIYFKYWLKILRIPQRAESRLQNTGQHIGLLSSSNQQQQKNCINPTLHEASKHPTRCAVSKSYSSSDPTARRVFGTVCMGNMERRQRWRLPRSASTLSGDSPKKYAQNLFSSFFLFFFSFCYEEDVTSGMQN